jgi:hypothetical protein
MRSRPLLKKLDCGYAYSQYGEDGLNSAENQFGIHNCLIEYSVIVKKTASRAQRCFLSRRSVGRIKAVYMEMEAVSCKSRQVVTR